MPPNAYLGTTCLFFLTSNVTTNMSRQGKHLTRIDFTGCQKLPTNSPSQEQEATSSKQKSLHAPQRLSRNTNSNHRDISCHGESARKVVGRDTKSPGLEENPFSRLIERHASPWDTYRRGLRCTLAGNVYIAARRSCPSRVVAIREYTRHDVAKMRRLYNVLDHDNILTARECFIHEECMYTLVDDLPLTLEQLVGCRSLYPTETELASILWQVCHS